MMSLFKKLSLAVIVGVLANTAVSQAAIRVVAALPDLGSIAAYIGGDKVDVSSIAKANSNPHSIEVFPSYMAKVSKAAIYLKCGLELDQWSNEIIDGSRNNKVVIVDCSQGIKVLEKPTGKVDASMGDVHPSGNPHYWLDPQNGIVIAQNISAALEKMDQANASYYQSRVDQFKKDCLDKMLRWKSEMAPLAGANIITYHSSWAYFADAFGFAIAAKVEPFPGIPPTGNHLAGLVNLIKEQKVAFILQEPYFSDDAPRFLNRETGIKVFKCAPSCQDVAPSSYFAHFEDIITQLTSVAGGKQPR
jgi:zinc/manganese transport system substrate-binding protein